MRYYVDRNETYCEVSEESPKGFKGVLFVTREARELAGRIIMSDTALSADQIKDMTPVEPEDIPEIYAEAFGIELPEPEPPRCVNPQNMPRGNSHDDIGELISPIWAIVVPWLCVVSFAFVFWIMDRIMP